MDSTNNISSCCFSSLISPLCWSQFQTPGGQNMSVAIPAPTFSQIQLQTHPAGRVLASGHKFPCFWWDHKPLLKMSLGPNECKAVISQPWIGSALPASGVGVNASGPMQSGSEGGMIPQTKTEGHHYKWGKWMLSCQNIKEYMANFSPRLY